MGGGGGRESGLEVEKCSPSTKVIHSETVNAGAARADRRDTAEVSWKRRQGGGGRLSIRGHLMNKALKLAHRGGGATVPRTLANLAEK